MEKFIIKRNGNVVPFDRNKIIAAISKTFIEVDGKLYETDTPQDIAREIEEDLKDEQTPIEKIQDMVEEYLMRSERPDVARAYIRYRYKREVAREYKNDFMIEVGKKLSGSNIENQNANVDESSFGGRKGEADNLLNKKYALDYIVSNMARQNHLNNEIYIHDLGDYAVGSHNCLSIPFDTLLANGFNTRQTDIRIANSVSTAFQLVAVIFQLQSLQQFGGVSATHLDWTMVPYVRKSFYKHYCDGIKYITESDYFWIPGTIGDTKIEKSQWKKMTNFMCEFFSIDDKHGYNDERAYRYAMDMTEREIQQAVEGMYHNLNTLQSRSGNQLPFTSINYGTCTKPEGRMVTKALLEGSIKGVGKFHRTPIFPCGIFQCMRGVNREKGDPNYDLYQLALESTVRRLYPNYANVDWSGNAGYDVRDPRTYFSTMGCRTVNGYDINGLGQQKDGRGNICPVTIILPTLAMEANCEIEEFIKLLDTKLHEAKDMLIERFDYICSQSPNAAKFMYENNCMAGYIPEEGIRSALKHGTLVIGQVGLAETLELLVGCNQLNEIGMKLAKRIEQLFKDRCAEFKQLYQLNFGVYYTPAENLCYTAMDKFKEKYGIIKKVSDHDYFTNSNHVPVWEKIDILKKIDIESQLTGYSSAGCITYIELDAGMERNIKAMEQLVNYAMDKDIPYFAINVPNDTCLNCGYTGEFNTACPECGSTNIQQLRRVTGYLTGNYKTAFNKGKIAETDARIKHVGIIE